VLPGIEPLAGESILMSIDLPRSSKELHFTGSVKALGPVRPANALAQERPRRPPPSPKPLPIVRGQLASVDDEIMTQALDRDAINAALFPVARRKNASSPTPNLPVPHFRSAAEARAHHAEPAIIVKTRKGGALPFSVWVIAALLAGIVSYQLAPQAMGGVAEAVRVLEAR
jgi:hypothetical protein